MRFHLSNDWRRASIVSSVIFRPMSSDGGEFVCAKNGCTGISEDGLLSGRHMPKDLGEVQTEVRSR